MVVDTEAMRVINGCCKMFDIIEEGVTTVEPLHEPRQPIPQMEAIYFMAPTMENANRLVKDFSDEKSPQYHSVHVFVTGIIPDRFMDALKACASLKARIKTLKELYVDFVTFEERVFHFDRPEAVANLYDAKTCSDEQDIIAERLVSLLATLNDYPEIRYSTSHALSGALAQRVQERLAKYAKSNKGWKPNSGDKRATLLILDRSHDMVAPLLHEFTYQAMIYDVLDDEVRPHVSFQMATDAANGEPPIANTFKYMVKTNKGQAQRSALFGDHDPLWKKLRHMHIAQVIDFVREDMNAFLKDNKAHNFDKDRVKKIDDMTEALRAMPEYQELMGKYEMHVYCAGACMNRFEESNLLEVATTEQGLATGETGSGQKVKNQMAAVSPLLNDPRVSMENKLRLVMIYIISQAGVEAKTRKKLIEMSELGDEEQRALQNLSKLGVSMKRASKPKKGVASLFSSSKKKKKTEEEEEIPYELSRFQPALRDVLMSAAKDSLDASAFATVSGSGAPGGKKSKKSGTNLRTNKPTWTSNKKSKKVQEYDGGRLIVFIAGGMTLSEVRTAYTVSDKTRKDIIIGSTSVLTPGTLLDSLKHIGESDGDSSSE